MRKGKQFSKAGLVLIIPLVLFPPYYHQVFLWSSSLDLFSLSKNCLAPHRPFFYHQPHYFSQHLCSTLLLVSPNLCEKESCSKSERIISQICPQSFNTKEHLLKRWSRRVCLLIGYPLASLNLATFAIELYCANFRKERTWGQELSDKRIATAQTIAMVG